VHVQHDQQHPILKYERAKTHRIFDLYRVKIISLFCGVKK